MNKNNKKTFTLLSIDPSMTRTGWALWVLNNDWNWCAEALIKYNYITTSKKTGCEGERLDIITGTVREIMRNYMVEKVIYEKDPPGGRYPNLNVYRRAVASVAMACRDHVGYEQIYGVYPQTWKSTGKKKATIEKVNLLHDLNLDYKDNDIADAIGIGIWFIDRQKLHPIKHDFTG